MTKRERVKKYLRDDSFVLADIEPLTNNQVKVWNSNKNMVLHGVAGTGKTFLSMYLALDDVLKNEYAQIVIIRSAVSTREMGFMPGDAEDKASFYEMAYVGITEELLGKPNSYELLKTSGKLRFITTSFIRGITIRDAVVIVDECQNMTYHELDSIITRVGDNCRIIFCGDFRQADLKNNGIKGFFSVLDDMRDEFDYIEFVADDIVRSGLVKQYILAKLRKEDEKGSTF